MNTITQKYFHHPDFATYFSGRSTYNDLDEISKNRCMKIHMKFALKISIGKN